MPTKTFRTKKWTITFISNSGDRELQVVYANDKERALAAVRERLKKLIEINHTDVSYVSDHQAGGQGSYVVVPYEESYKTP
jgi:hypothetical protein